jgi:hypothetical protein
MPFHSRFELILAVNTPHELEEGKNVIFMKPQRLNSVMTRSYAHCMNESVTVNVYDPRFIEF